jgi:hypothetical protein
LSCLLDEIRPHQVRFASEFGLLRNSNWPLLGQSALDADGSRQENNSGIANIRGNPMVILIIVLIINDFNVHTVGQKTQARRLGIYVNPKMLRFAKK